MGYVKTTLLMSLLFGLFIVAGSALGGQSGAIFGFIFALATNFIAYYSSDKIVLKMYKAVPIDEAKAPEIFSMTRELCQNAELPMPKLFVMNNPTPNAFATGRDPEHGVVALTTGIINLLSNDELKGVIAHELAHIKNRDILISTIAATFAGAISFMANMAMWSSMFGGRGNRNVHPAVYIFMMILAPMAAMMVQMTISRSREFEADRIGAKMARSPFGLSGALKKLEAGNKQIPMEKVNEATAHMFIVSPLSASKLKGLFTTHPPLEERVARLESMTEIG